MLLNKGVGAVALYWVCLQWDWIFLHGSSTPVGVSIKTMITVTFQVKYWILNFSTELFPHSAADMNDLMWFMWFVKLRVCALSMLFENVQNLTRAISTDHNIIETWWWTHLFVSNYLATTKQSSSNHPEHFSIIKAPLTFT